MEADLLQQTDLLYHAPEGTCLEVAPGMWLVRGKTASYEVSERDGACNCKAFEHHPKPWGCKHLEALKRFLEREGKTCPCCKGEGCGACDNGKVDSEYYPILLEVIRIEDQARLDYLKEVFR